MVKKITSKPMSSRSHGMASAMAPVLMMLSMQRMVPRITGIIKGNKTRGKSSSRALARKVMAAVIVPKTQKPRVPNKVTKKSRGSKFHADKLNKTQNNGMTTSSTTNIKTKLKPVLAKNNAPRSRGDNSNASRQ